MEPKKSAGFRFFLIFLVLVGLAVASYFYLSHQVREEVPAVTTEPGMRIDTTGAPAMR